jgi:tetratricopeptide (TPR) repeat protein
MYRWSDLPGVDYWADIPARKRPRKQETLKKETPKQAEPAGEPERESPGAREKLNRAVRAGNRRDYKKAISILEELISSFDAPPEAYLFLGRAYHALKEYTRALAAFNDFVRLMPQSPEGYRFAGRSYLTLGMPRQAAPLLKKALELRPGDALTLALLGTAYLKSKHSQEAADTFRQAVEAAPQNKRIYRAYLNALLIRGIRLCRAEDYNLGIQMLRFVLDNGLDIPLLRLELGRACRETGELEEAVEHYSRALEYAPGDIRIRWYRASILMSLGRNAEALGEIAAIRSAGGELEEQMLPSLPWNSELVDRFMIRAFLEAGQWRRAAESARNWLKHRPPDPLIHAMFAEAQRNLRDYPSAINHLDQALKLAPAQIQLWYALVLSAWEGENWNALRRALKNLKSLGGERDIIRRFSILLESKTGGDEEHILSLLQNAVRTLGPEPELMYALGERYLQMGLIEAALTWFKKTLLLQDRHEKARLGEIAAREALVREGAPGAEGELRAAYDGYLALWPDNYPIRRDRALYLVRQGDFQTAAGELEGLLAWEPANPTLRRVLAYAYRKTGRFREAAVFLKALLKEKLKDTGLLLEYSGCLARAGAPQYALAVLEKALKVFPKSAEVPLALGLLFYRDRQFERAQALLRESAARNPADPRPYQWMAAIARQKGDAERERKYEAEAAKRKGPPPKTAKPG